MVGKEKPPLETTSDGSNLAHEKRLSEMTAQTWRAVELTLSQDPAAARPESILNLSRGSD